MRFEKKGVFFLYFPNLSLPDRFSKRLEAPFHFLRDLRNSVKNGEYAKQLFQN